MLNEGTRYLESAAHELEGDHAISVANSSKAIEFAAKSLLDLAGFSYPLRHDIGPGLELVQRSLVGGEDDESLPRAQRYVARIGMLCDLQGHILHSAAEYGYAGTLASLILNKTDARVFYDYGRECLDIASWVVDGVRKGTFRVEQVEPPPKVRSKPHEVGSNRSGAAASSDWR